LVIEINIQDISDPYVISPDHWSNYFEKWINYIELELSPTRSYELSLILTDDRQVQLLNSQYRHKDQPTDVLAFAALETEVPIANFHTDEPLYLGDIIISLETANKQAIDQGHSLTKELIWLASHGFLHLLGWDHPDDDSLTAMLTKQEELLELLRSQLGGQLD
jgi:probable rRNA maturation factor